MSETPKNTRKHGEAAPLDGQPALTYREVIETVRTASDLTPGVRGNIISALRRVANLLPGAAGDTRMVDVKALARLFARVTPAKLGFKSANSLAAFKSNIQRGLQLAGF